MGDSSISAREPTIGVVHAPTRKAARQRVRPALISGLALALGDIIAAQVATLLTVVAWSIIPGYREIAVLGLPVLGAALALAATGLAAAFGLYDTAGRTPLERFRLRIYVVTILPWLVVALVALARPVMTEAVVLLGITALVFLPLALLSEAVIRKILIARSTWGADVLLFGSAEAAGPLADDLLAQPENGLRPIGYCGDPGTPGRPLALPRLGSYADVHRLAGVADIAMILHSSEARAFDLALLPFDRVVVVPDIGGVPATPMRIRAFGVCVGYEFANPARIRLHQHAKRLLDLLVAVPALLVALPLILFIALAIRLLSPGPALYVQHRVGWKGSWVAILKLRSMYVDADLRLDELLQRDPEARREWETHVKLSRDPRVLPIVGDFIRRKSIDELPQLWNVVRGDISLVGPRPLPAYHIEKFAPEFQRLRCSVQPGLTGLWQVSDRSSADLRRQEEIDTFYIRNWSLWLDLYIVFRTIPAVLRARGAR